MGSTPPGGKGLLDSSAILRYPHSLDSPLLCAV
nr:MAG TPA_asm: hypothetical protein [Caudoviricetes sp.]